MIKGYLFTYLKYLSENSNFIHPESVILMTDKRKIVLDVGNHFIQGENTISKRADGGLHTVQILVELEQQVTRRSPWHSAFSGKSLSRYLSYSVF